MIVIIDYGVGNLFSLNCSLQAIGQQTVVTSDPDVIRKADRIILPGVGAFEDAAKKLRESGLDKLIRELAEEGKPLLGICLGMQLLLDGSEEYGYHQGLGLIAGTCKDLAQKLPASYKIPHMGWNRLTLVKPDHPLFRYLEEDEYVYFVHSYASFDFGDSVIATAEYGLPVMAAIARNNVMGTQFHPEKSGDTGLRILKAFCQLNKEDLC